MQTTTRRGFGLGLLALAGGKALARSATAAATRGNSPASAAAREAGLVFPLAADPQAWDSLTMSTPRVLRLGSRDFRMWYYGRDPAFDRSRRCCTAIRRWARPRWSAWLIRNGASG